MATPAALSPAAFPHANGPASSLSPAAERAALRRSAVEFEGVYLSQMLTPMFENLGAEEPFGGGLSEDIWRSFQIEEYGKAIARAGGIGLADAVFRELLQVQERKG